MPRVQLLRLGFFQFAAGGLSVLFLGVLNRVLRVEHGLDLLTVSVLIGGGHYLGALIAIPFGHFSDTHPIAGYRRTPYILLGILVTAGILLASPWVGIWVASDPSPGRVVLAFLFFFIEGLSTYVAGTAYLALITDKTSEEERGGATAFIWTMLMLGIIATAIGTGYALRDYQTSRLMAIFGVGAGGAVLLAFLALWRQENRIQEVVQRGTGKLRDAFRMVMTNRHSRAFAAFLLVSMFSYFMQDVILEPFGGEVFGLGPAETTRFNAYMGIGVVSGMLLGGIKLIPPFGKSWTASRGIALMIVGFLALTLSSLSGVPQMLPLILLVLGFGAGLFTVGGVALMMDMTSTKFTGLFVGAWTMVQALAKGPAAIVGGALQTAAVKSGLGIAQAYGVVFIVEAIGLGLSLFFLRQIVVEDFRVEIDRYGAIAPEPSK